MELPSALLIPSLKSKKIHSERISYIFSKKAFLIFRKFTLDKFLCILIFWEFELSGSNFKKFLYFLIF